MPHFATFPRDIYIYIYIQKKESIAIVMTCGLICACVRACA